MITELKELQTISQNNNNDSSINFEDFFIVQTPYYVKQHAFNIIFTKKYQ